MHSQNSRVFKGFQDAYEPCLYIDRKNSIFDRASESNILHEFDSGSI